MARKFTRSGNSVPRASVRITVRLTRREYEAAEALAKERSLTLSQYVGLVATLAIRAEINNSN